ARRAHSRRQRPRVRRGNMFHKASILAATVAIVLAVAPYADAKQGKQGKGAHAGKSAHVSKSVHVKKNVHVRYVIGLSYTGHICYGHHGYCWHGAWYAYGVGPSWVLVDGLW